MFPIILGLKILPFMNISRYPLVLIAMYNVWDLIARYIPLIDFIKLESRKGLFIATVSRILFIPCFYFTAKYGDQGWMIMLISFLGLTNGYLTVCVLTVAPRGYKVRPVKENPIKTVLFFRFIDFDFVFAGNGAKCVG